MRKPSEAARAIARAAQLCGVEPVAVMAWPCEFLNAVLINNGAESMASIESLLDEAEQRCNEQEAEAESQSPSKQTETTLDGSSSEFGGL